jgi:hypothetical protein
MKWYTARRLIFVAVTGIILILVLAAIMSGGGSDQRATLRSQEYVTNPLITAVFLLTNPGPDEVDYFAYQERGSNTTTFVASGTLSGRSTIQLQIPLSETPTRLLVGCSMRHGLRDLTDVLRSLLGLQAPLRENDYLLSSEELKK